MRSMRGLRGLAIVTAALMAMGLLGATACGTDAVGIEACQKIEKVRCESAQACGINLERPLHQGNSPEQNVAACIRYYDDQCLHGIVGAKKDPAPQAVDACADAIITGDCSVVKEPQTHTACAFLIPPATATTTTDA